jgi:hypothetical protein
VAEIMDESEINATFGGDGDEDDEAMPLARRDTQRNQWLHIFHLGK